MNKESEEKVLAITLKDGPHRLTVPTWKEIEYVQDQGYPISVFARSTDRVPEVVAETIREARVAASMALPLVKGEKRVVWTPEQVIEAIGAINPPFGAVMDYASIRVHLTALLRASEPAEGWTDAKVAAVMVPADVYKYSSLMQRLYDAAFPKAAAGGSTGEA